MTSSRKLTPEGPTKPETQRDLGAEGQRKQGRPSHYKQKVLPELVSPDPDVVTEEARLRSADGWYQAILDVRRAAEAGDFPPPFAAISTTRTIMDGLIFSNKTLSGPLLLPLPEGARLVGRAAPPQADDPLPDPMTARDPDGLVPVPLWVLAWLATVHQQAIIELRADTDGKREKSSTTFAF